MNLRILICLLLSALFYFPSARAQMADMDRMFLVLVNVEKPADIALCYTTKFDKKRVAIDFAFEDTINYLSDFIYEEEELYGPDCFVPEMKLIFRHYTYIVSLYCTSAIKYKNSAPFTTSSVRMKNDLVFTSSVYQFLNRLKVRHFANKSPNKSLIDKVVTSDPLEDPDNNIDDLDKMFLSEDEVDDLDTELQDEAGENGAMFDEIEIDDDDDDEDLLVEPDGAKKPVGKSRAAGK